MYQTYKKYDSTVELFCGSGAIHDFSTSMFKYRVSLSYSARYMYIVLVCDQLEIRDNL